MSESSGNLIRYQVVYSEYVRNEMKKLIARAKERGLDGQVRAAVTEMDRVLHVFPQFGDPLVDLSFVPGQIRIVTVAPLVVRYALYEEQRLVIVSRPIMSQPHSGL